MQEDRLVLNARPHQLAWARVTLVGGRTASDRWQIDSTKGPTRVLVGSGPGCGFTIRRQGVAPAHVGFYWDGGRLWIADIHGLGGVAIDGTPVTSWQLIAGRVRLDIGTAVLVAESSLRPEPLPFGGPPPMPADTEEELVLAATVIAPARESVAPPKPRPPAARATPPVPTPPRWTYPAATRTARRPTGSRLSLPLRTWGLVAATCSALLIVMLMQPARSTGAPRARKPTSTAPATPAAPAAAPVPQPATASPDVTAARAADLLLAGRNLEALAYYDELARAHPDRPVNAAIVKILKRRLAERCREADGADCAR